MSEGAGPRLATPRLLLRRWRDADVDPFAAMNADPVVMEHFPATLDRDQTAALVESFEQRFEEHGYGLWAVEVVDPPELRSPFVGFVGLNFTDWPAHFTPAVEIGWRLAADQWGRGYATEGAREAIRFGFEDLGLDEIVSFTVPANLRSRAVMERLGMVRNPDDDFDHPRVDPTSPFHRHVLYRLARADWR
ncbi:MAG TPA: GNAT family N-acetyltransferase [Acidimicrobiia bacterium]|nr:GNAT family N-acetyltransferase [Acidimicrobiia bacterium]